MNCEEKIKASGFACTPSGKNAYRVFAPFSVWGNDANAALFVAQTSDASFYITDAGETALFAEHLGIDLNANRIDALNNTYSITRAKIDETMAITASGEMPDLSAALWDGFKLMLALAFRKEQWQPRPTQERFRDVVINGLTEQLGEKRIIRNAEIKAASGNIIRFPLGVIRGNDTTAYVDTLAAENGRFNWNRVYEISGRFHDVQNTSDANDNRITLLEPCEDTKENRNIINHLSETSAVYRYSQNLTAAFQ